MFYTMSEPGTLLLPDGTSTQCLVTNTLNFVDRYKSLLEKLQSYTEKVYLSFFFISSVRSSTIETMMLWFKVNSSSVHLKFYVRLLPNLHV